MIPHEWRKTNDRSSKREKPGFWYECITCKHKVFRPDEFSDFQFRLSVVTSFMDIAEEFEKNIGKSKYKQFQDALNKARKDKRISEGDMGIHGFLSENCGLFDLLVIAEIHEDIV